MSRFVKQSARILAVALVGVALATAPVSGRDQNSPLVPPNANFRGKSFEEWNTLFVQWVVQTNLGGQTPSDTVRKVRFLPANTTPGAYEFNVHLDPGTAFVQSPFPVFGERYDNGTADDPNDPIIDYIFETTDVRVELNGQVLMDDAASELGRYGFGPVYFHQPIVYAEPQPRGPNLNAIAALFTLGVGAVYHPLPPGNHTLRVDVDGLLGAYHFTYHITVG
jgi:hypothetical protein